MDLSEKVEDAIAHIDWMVDIDTKFGTRHIVETLELPHYLKDSFREKIKQHIIDKCTKCHIIHLGHLGNKASGDRIIAEINNISNQNKIRTKDIKVYNNNEEDELVLEYKIPWSQIKMHELVNLEYSRIVTRYKRDYDTMIRVEALKIPFKKLK